MPIFTGKLLLLGPVADGVHKRSQPVIQPGTHLEEAGVSHGESDEKVRQRRLKHMNRTTSSHILILTQCQGNPYERSHVPVVDCNVPLEIKLAIVELDNGETSGADHLDIVHAGHTASKDCCN